MLNSAICPMTTGDCCAAAARAAAADLIFRIRTETVSITHAGKIVTIPVARQDDGCDKNGSEYMAEMSGGTPPDIKDKAKIFVKVSYIDDFMRLTDKAFIDIRYGNLFMQAGEGIGIASGDRPGIKHGQALVEPDARKMIFEAVADVCSISDGAQLLLITVKCPDGMMTIIDYKNQKRSFVNFLPDDGIEIDSIIKQAVYSENAMIFSNGKGRFLYMTTRERYAFIFSINS